MKGGTSSIATGTRHARITAGSTVFTLAPGDSVTFGRGVDQDIRIGHEPADLRIPRRAGRLECRDGGVLIHNVSDKRTMVARGFPGPPFDILPLTLVGSVPHDVLQLSIEGESGNRYAINIDTRPLQVGVAAPVVGGADDPQTVGYVRIPTLSRRERQLLVALCLPAWSGTMRLDEVPSYAELSDMFRRRGIGVSDGRIRKGLDELREKLAEEHGVVGVSTGRSGGDIGRAGKHSFLPALARWARASGNVTEDELEKFDEGDVDV